MSFRAFTLLLFCRGGSDSPHPCTVRKSSWTSLRPWAASHSASGQASGMRAVWFFGGQRMGFPDRSDLWVS